MPKDKRDIAHHFGGVGRWLPGQVGRPWQQVHSELHAMFDARGEVGYYALEYLGVDTNCHIEEDGRIVANTKSGPRKPYGLYVHPTTGLLCDAHAQRISRGKQRAKFRARAVITCIVLDHERNYELIDGIWYRKEFEYHQPGEVWKIYYFDPTKEAQAYHELRKVGDRHVIYYSAVPMQARIERGKFQCSKEERLWIDWFLAKARAGGIEVKWNRNRDRIEGETVILEVTHALPRMSRNKPKKIRDTRLPHQGHPAPSVNARPEKTRVPAELLYETTGAPVVHRTAF